MDITDRVLFLKYALPCAETLVQRGAVTQEKIDNLIQIISKNKKIPADSEKMFKVARAMCTLIAQRKNKKEIDAAVVRQYFLWGHDAAVEKRHEEMGDFDPERCRTLPGKVMEIKGTRAEVKTPRGIRSYRTEFLPDIKKGELVIVHRDFVVERIDAATADKLLAVKELSCGKITLY